MSDRRETRPRIYYLVALLCLVGCNPISVPRQPMKHVCISIPLHVQQGGIREEQETARALYKAFQSLNTTEVYCEPDVRASEVYALEITINGDPFFRVGLPLQFPDVERDQ